VRHTALNGEDLTLGLLRLLQGTNAGAGIVLDDEPTEPVYQRAVDPLQGHGNNPYQSEDPLLTAIRRAARC